MIRSVLIAFVPFLLSPRQCDRPGSLRQPGLPSGEQRTCSSTRSSVPKAKLQRLQRQYQLGDSRDHGRIADSLLRSKDISLADADRSRPMRKLMNVEIKALEDLTAGDEATFDGIVSREAAGESPIQSLSSIDEVTV